MRVVYALTIFVSALLLFWVQPMFTKMVLPLLGGSPAVWNGALVFFQGALLVGYLYAHLTAKWLSIRHQIRLHLAVLLLALVALPVAVPAGWTPPTETTPVPWLLGVLTVGLGLPFVMLASGSPMLQRWFAHSDHPSADDPYPLYAVSNLGSLSALLAYPFLFEPNVRLATQSRLWSGGFVLLIVLTAVAAAYTARSRRTETAATRSDAAAGSPGTAEAHPSRPVAWPDRVWWIGLAFVPSSLLLGVTTYLTTDVAAVPLLWVLPLALYLLTFVIVFARRRRFTSHATARLIQVAAVATLVLFVYWGGEGSIWWVFGLHLTVFFFSALVVHGELAARRPPPAHLTAFYFWMSLGGVLGGMFNALLAPIIFDSIVEYEWMVVAACALGWRWARAPWRERLRHHVALVVPVAVLGTLMYFERRLGPPTTLAIAGASVIALVSMMVLRRAAGHFAASVAAILVLTGIYHDRWEGIEYADRGFFGAYSVVYEAQRNYRYFQHGTTVHGAQFVDSTRRLTPPTYYHRDGPIGQLRERLGPGLVGTNVAVLGLGTGALACFGRPDQRWTFYEIDPGVARVATNPRYFTYLEDCPPRVQIILGDGRLSLSRAATGAFDLIVLDAFSSDAVPVHLLTRDAFEIYLDKLSPGGIVLVHISNRYLDLRPVLSNLAAALDLDARFQSFGGLTAEQEADLAYESDWVIVSPDPTALAAIDADPRWTPLDPGSPHDAWTDDYSDIVSLIRWR